MRLEPYMECFWKATRAPFPRLPDWAFEQMNRLPNGMLHDLREFCDVRDNLKEWTKLNDVGDAMCLILRGAVSMVQGLEKPSGVENIAKAAVENQGIQGELRGFTFRQRKRLHKRLPPGYLFGQGAFFWSRQVWCWTLHWSLSLSYLPRVV